KNFEMFIIDKGLTCLGWETRLCSIGSSTIFKPTATPALSAAINPLSMASKMKIADTSVPDAD
ncbi:MAG: hypothetical protein ACP5EK_02170, partial [Thermoplasmatota archaeon]